MQVFLPHLDTDLLFSSALPQAIVSLCLHPGGYRFCCPFPGSLTLSLPTSDGIREACDISCLSLHRNNAWGGGASSRLLLCPQHFFRSPVEGRADSTLSGSLSYLSPEPDLWYFAKRLPGLFCSFLSLSVGRLCPVFCHRDGFHVLYLQERAYSSLKLLLARYLQPHLFGEFKRSYDFTV